MIGRFLMTNRWAFIVASGVMIGAAMTPVKAADLGGRCCADLEERVAELEATTARKGNRTVSLQIYGQVSKALLIWDDGIDSDAFVVDNTLASTRLGMRGEARIKSGLTAGYLIEFETNDARADEVNNGRSKPGFYHGNDVARKNGDDPEGDSAGLVLRHNNWYIDSDRLGRITVGTGNTAFSGATEVVLGNSLRNADANIGAGFNIRVKGGGRDGFLNVPGYEWAWDFSGNASRNQVIRYDTPAIYGFMLSASWGDNDYADVALRFKKDFGTVRLAAAISYQWDNQTGLDSDGHSHDFETLGGSVSAMHMPTGLYAAFSAGRRNYEDQGFEDESFWYLQGGIEKRVLSSGATTVYGEYGRYEGFHQSEYALMDNSEAKRLGFGVNQKIDAASMDLYAHATVWNFDDNTKADYQDLSTLMLGSRLQF
jgi:hypothetical protein